MVRDKFSAVPDAALSPATFPPDAVLPEQGGRLIRMLPERAGHSVELQVGGGLPGAGGGGAHGRGRARPLRPPPAPRCLLSSAPNPAPPRSLRPLRAPRRAPCSGPPCRSKPTTARCPHTTCHTCWGALLLMLGLLGGFAGGFTAGSGLRPWRTQQCQRPAAAPLPGRTPSSTPAAPRPPPQARGRGQRFRAPQGPRLGDRAGGRRGGHQLQARRFVRGGVGRGQAARRHRTCTVPCRASHPAPATLPSLPAPHAYAADAPSSHSPTAPLTVPCFPAHPAHPAPPRPPPPQRPLLLHVPGGPHGRGAGAGGRGRGGALPVRLSAAQAACCRHGWAGIKGSGCKAWVGWWRCSSGEQGRGAGSADWGGPALPPFHACALLHACACTLHPSSPAPQLPGPAAGAGGREPGDVGRNAGAGGCARHPL